MPDGRLVLEPRTLSQLRHLSLRARLVVEGFIAGLHRSPYHGFSVEFSEHRQYMPGDEIRQLDWKIYAKTDRYYVKQFEEETNLKAYLLLDASGSMGFGSGQVTKLDFGGLLAGSLTYLLLKQRDAVGLCLFDNRPRILIPPSSKPSYLNIVLSQLEAAVPGEESNLAATFHELAERIHRRGLIIVISDLLDDIDDVITGLRHFRHKKHEVIVFHTLDPAEMDLDFKDTVEFEDAETGLKITTQPEHIRSAYRRKVADFISTYRARCRDQNIDYVLLRTSDSLEGALTEYLNTRKRIGG